MMSRLVKASTSPRTFGCVLVNWHSGATLHRTMKEKGIIFDVCDNGNCKSRMNSTNLPCLESWWGEGAPVIIPTLPGGPKNAPPIKADGAELPLFCGEESAS